MQKLHLSIRGRFVALGLAAVAGIAVSDRSASAAPIPVYLNFDSGGGGSFLTQINAAATAATLPANYFPAVDVPNIENAIQNVMTGVYGNFNIAFAQVAGGREEDFGTAGAGGIFGQAPYNWRNATLPGTNIPPGNAEIYSSEFDDSLTVANTVAQNEAALEIAIGDTAAHELGHTFGLNHQDAYGIPGITPANYSNTLGLQNAQIMASGVTGLLDTQRPIPRSFGQMEIATLAQDAGGVYTAGGWTPNYIPDSAVAHGTPATAQPITFKYLPIANESVVTITDNNIAAGDIAAGAHDMFKFTAAAGQLLTADTIAQVTAQDDSGELVSKPFFQSPADPILTLYELVNGNPVEIASSVDKEYKNNNWLSGTQVDADPMILNQPLPDNATYLLDVENNGATGNYEMFVSVPEPASLGLILLAGSALSLRRKKMA